MSDIPKWTLKGDWFSKDGKSPFGEFKGFKGMTFKKIDTDKFVKSLKLSM